jgi:chaperonin cofactor prefoldin
MANLNKSKEELIKEIDALKKREQGISMILNEINEMFYGDSQ